MIAALQERIPGVRVLPESPTVMSFGKPGMSAECRAGLVEWTPRLK